MSIEKYVVTNYWNISRFGASFNRGDVLSFDKEKGTISVNGKTYEDASREVAAGKKIISASTKTAILVPFNDKISKQIIADVAKRIEEKVKMIPDVPKMKVINSDDDLLDVINIDIKRDEAPKKQPLPNLDKKLDVVEECGVVSTLESAESLEAQVEMLQSPLKMKVVSADNTEVTVGKGLKPMASAGLKINPITSKAPTTKKGKK